MFLARFKTKSIKQLLKISSIKTITLWHLKIKTFEIKHNPERTTCV